MRFWRVPKGLCRCAEPRQWSSITLQLDVGANFASMRFCPRSNFNSLLVPARWASGQDFGGRSIVHERQYDCLADCNA